MDNDCHIIELSENISKAAQRLARDLRRFQSILRRCPDCQGYYCPELLEASPRIERALKEIDEAQSQILEGI